MELLFVCLLLRRKREDLILFCLKNRVIVGFEGIINEEE